MEIPAENDMPAKRSDRKKFLPPVPVSHQQTKTLYPYHVMEKNEKYDVHLFHISKSLTVKIHTGDIIKANTSAIVSTEDNKFSGEGEIAKGILKTAGSAYGQEHKELQKIMHNELEIEETNAGDLHFIKVYHVVIPTPKQKMNKTEEERYFNIVSSAVQSVLVMLVFLNIFSSFFVIL
ncbi:hypothetical protein KUTeg_004787 [Tegillarca granosa]|uniref:Macro domain-containing protein n=1 Tax=Tegillarca granosa TaxID=220873 RepID=A0ABQ9FHV2_TEGGR|nr:hypothetical protein KUTeg_004787 [Tegillarca granosa]